MNKVIVLAAGKGTRMDSNLPKVLVPVNGRPMIEYLIEEIIRSEVTRRPIIVVSPDNKEIIKEALRGFDCEYAVQEEQLGTGHAFSCARKLIDPEVKNLIGLYGDHPFVRKETIRNLLDAHNENLTMMTTNLEDFENWRNNFYQWGRIIRDDEGQIKEIIEFKDAPDEIRKVKEVNPSFFCFNSSWLWNNIDKITNHNKQNEYYLTDMVKIATNEGNKIESLIIDPLEALGVNSKEELEIAENLIKSKRIEDL